MPDKKFDYQHLPVLGLVLLIAGFSMYGIISFITSANAYTDGMSASVIAADSDADSATAIPDAEKPKAIFIDVDIAHENATAIAYFKQIGWVSGYEDGTFKPGNLVSRAEFMRILTEVVGADFAGGTFEKCFKDIKTEWYATVVCYAAKVGWVSGFDDGTFRPTQTVSRSEAVIMTIKALGLKVADKVTVAPFKDTPVDAWFAPYAKFMKDAKIITGNNFLPNISMTRASVVQLIYNILVSVGKV